MTCQWATGTRRSAEPTPPPKTTLITCLSQSFLPCGAWHTVLGWPGNAVVLPLVSLRVKIEWVNKNCWRLGSPGSRRPYKSPDCFLVYCQFKRPNDLMTQRLAYPITVVWVLFWHLSYLSLIVVLFLDLSSSVPWLLRLNSTPCLLIN